MPDPLGEGPLSVSDVLGVLTGSPEDIRPPRLRISRPCYDKMHRCPGWAGGGFRYAKVRRCDDGRLNCYRGSDGNLKKLAEWRFNQCPKCKVVVLPSVARWLDWRWLTWWASRKWRDFKYERSMR